MRAFHPRGCRVPTVHNVEPCPERVSSVCELSTRYHPSPLHGLFCIPQTYLIHVHSVTGLSVMHSHMQLHLQSAVSLTADMLERGFEWTLHNGSPRNSGARWAPAPEAEPCCALKWLGNVSGIATWVAVFGGPCHGVLTCAA